MGKYLVYLISLALIGLGGWLLVPPYSAPDRNVIGDPGEERLLSQCDTGTPVWTIRLYDGSNALGGTWQSITATAAGADERQWFYSLLKPRLKSVICSGDAIELHGTTGVVENVATRDLPQYIKSPMAYNRGQEEKHEWNGQRADHSTEFMIKIAGGLILVFFGAAVAWITSRVTGGRERMS